MLMATRGPSETSPPRQLTETSRGSMPVPGREPAGPVTSALRRGPGAMVNTPGEYRQSRPPPRSTQMGAIQRASHPPLPSRYGSDYCAASGRHPADPACFPISPVAAAKVCYIVSVLSCHSIRCFLLSCPRLALDSVSHPDPCSSCAPPAKPYGPASAWPWLFPGVDPSSAFPVPCPPHRPVPGCSWPSC